MKNFFFLIFSVLLITSCNFDERVEDEKEKYDFKKDLIFSEVDGEEFKEALETEGARMVSALILLGHTKEVQPEMIAMVADSLMLEDSLWRNRHYEAISIYNDTYDDIPESLNYKFGIAIFGMLMYHPQEVIQHFDEASGLELAFWNDRLAEEIHHNVKEEDIPMESMIKMSQDHCESCDSTLLNTIEKMIITLGQDHF